MTSPPTPVRARNAASLVLVRRGRGREPEVLLGRRGGSDAFMPGWFVFPGGSVRASDARHVCVSELRPSVASALEAHATPTVARALAVAAIRETLEETGFALGAPEGEIGLRPDLGALDYFARAITPTMSPIRFHARFFLTEVAERSACGPLSGDGELGDLGWFSLERAGQLQMVDVTRFVLEEAGRVLAGERRGVPLYRYRGAVGRAVYP